MKLLAKEQQKSYENAKLCFICKKKNLKINMLKIKKISKSQELLSLHKWIKRCSTHNTCNLKYSVPKKILMFFTMGLTMITRRT